MNPANQFFPVDPDLIPPPNYAAYREFIAGLRQGVLRDEAELQHYRRAAELDSTFVAPLVQLAYRATWGDQCDLTDSIATVLDRRRERLTDWDRFTIDLLRARCQGDMARAVALLGQRLDRYPQSLTAKRQYSSALQFSNQPMANRRMLSRLDPELDPEGRQSREELRAAYWWFMAASHHMLGDYLEEVEITDRWRDSSSWAWSPIRGRALAALGREREALGLLERMLAGSIASVAGPSLGMAAELDAHGYPATAKVVAESVLARLTLAPVGDVDVSKHIAMANLLLGRPQQERIALDEIARSDPDSLAVLEAQGRIAVLSADTAQAEHIDRVLAEHSERPLLTPTIRGAQILARAHIAAGFGRREQAIALLQAASAHGMLSLGPSHAFHADPLLAPLRGYPPFEALLRPDN